MKVLGLTMVIIFVALTTLFVFVYMRASPLQVETISMQYVVDDRIFEDGKEVVWRGYGGTYLFTEDTDYLQAWENHLQEINKMKANGLNTMRLAFRFPFDNVSSADLLNCTKLDEVLNWLNLHGLRVILDNHGGEGFGSQELVDAWVELASRYENDPRIVAYELFNEPFYDTREPWVDTPQDCVFVYHQLTEAVRRVDPDHIHVWQARENYFKGTTLEELRNYLQPNVVYTKHLWWTWRPYEFDLWSIKDISIKDIGYLVELRRTLDAPVWLGEYGLGGGGNWKYEKSDPYSQIAEELTYRCEEQAIGWNLWGGAMKKDKPWYASAMFPLEVYNEKLTRQPFLLETPKLTDYITDSYHVDDFEPYQIRLRHHNDYVVFEEGVQIIVVVTQRLSDKRSDVIVLSKEDMETYSGLKIQNVEGRSLGDRETVIYMRIFVLD